MGTTARRRASGKCLAAIREFQQEPDEGWREFGVRLQAIGECPQTIASRLREIGKFLQAICQNHSLR
jgi:hypothetical protein